jgi:riboflavin kinase/FMN adenylyltransferase
VCLFICLNFVALESVQETQVHPVDPTPFSVIIRPVDLKPKVITIGNFDGVHIGHQALVKSACDLARMEELSVAAMFFNPHPTSVLRPEQAPEKLTTVARRQELLLQHGVDEVIIQPFDAHFAQLSPIEFIQKLTREHAIKAIVVGHDFRFGHRALGNVHTLREVGTDLGFQVHTVEAQRCENITASSTKIRAALREGDVVQAARFLDRYHDVEGIIGKGNQRGRTIGFPTANLFEVENQIPGHGVYAVCARLLTKPKHILNGVMNIGVRPTIENHPSRVEPSLEVHLFDFSDDIYHQSMRVALVAKLRDEKKFPSFEALKNQIARDAEQGRRTLDSVDKEKLQWL